MNDPHVEWLVYRLEVGATLTFNAPPPLERETDGFKLLLEAGKLTVSMKEHHASIDSARSRVEPLLRSWELDNWLTYGPGSFRFLYEEGKVIDRNPPPPGSPQTIQVRVGSYAIVGADVTLVIGRREYPPPPTNFTTSPDVETLWHRYQGYLEGKELLSSMAYFCLTVLEGLGRGREGAATKFEIDEKVLRKLGELTSTKGDEKTARKFLAPGMLRPYSPQEETWIKDVIRALIRRVGEHAAGVIPLKKLSMADFPPLPL